MQQGENVVGFAVPVCGGRGTPIPAAIIPNGMEGLAEDRPNIIPG